MIVDGRAIAADILIRAKQKVSNTSRDQIPLVRAVVVSPNAATESYLRVKSARAEDAGMYLDIVRPQIATTESLIGAVQTQNNNGSEPDAIIVQLPLPEFIDNARVLDAIPLEKDADVLSARAYDNFINNSKGALLPPVVGAIKEVLARAGVQITGKRAVVVGNGRLVGQPAQVWLEAQGANVIVITRQSGGMEELANADIIIAGAGSPHLIKPQHIKQRVVLIDAGTSESNGAIAGDADPACAEKASVFTPVPGGIGPIAVACLFENAANLFAAAHQATPNHF